MKETWIDPALVPKKRLADGTELPTLGIGTFGSDKYAPDQVSQAVAGAIRAGYRLIDCAAVYGNEDRIGQVLREAFDQGVARREELYITSKVWNDMHGPGDVLLSLAKTLKDLGLTYVDTYFVHWPFPNYHAPGCDGDARNPDSVPFDPERFLATWRQMERVQRMGLARNIGMSNMTIPKLEAVLPFCEIKPVLLEMELHPAFQQKELFDYAVAHGITPVGFCPLGSPSRPERDRAAGDIAAMDLPEIREIAAAHGVHPALICLKWAAQRGAVPIPFSVKEAQYVENLRCVTEDPLTPEELERIAAADRNCRLIKGQVFLWPGAKNWEDLWDLDGVLVK